MPNREYTRIDCGHKTTQPQYSCNYCHPEKVDQEILEDMNLNEQLVREYEANGRLRDKFLEFTDEYINYDEYDGLPKNNEPKRNLILVRGASGSGKSTIANLLHTSIDPYKTICHHISADEYFMSDLTDENYNNQNFNRDYNFNRNDLKDAHKFCQMVTEYYMYSYLNTMSFNTSNWHPMSLDGKHKLKHVIIVHNTFTKEWEMKPYLELAEIFKYRVTTIIAENRHESESIHNVPDDVVSLQKERFDIKL